LPLQAVHGDLTDDNVVCAPDESGQPVITGVIDFGDTMYSWRVAELAVACSAVFHHDPDNPLAVLPLVEAFSREVRLTDAELCALWPLIVLRGAVLVVSGEQQVAIDPTNDYAQSALEHEWKIFQTPAGYDWQAAEAALRPAAGLPRSGPAGGPGSAGFPLLPALAGRAPSVLDFGWNSDAFTGGSWLGTREEQAAEEARIIAAAVAASGAAAARYGEARLTRSGTLSRTEPANVAIALEVHVAGPCAVHAPFAGTVAESGAGSLRLEGPEQTLLLAGITADAALAPGQEVAAGSRLGRTGSALVVGLAAAGALQSGPQAPPRFVKASEFPAFAALYRDPAPLLGGVLPENGREDAAAVLERRKRSYAALQGHYYPAPPRIERGWK
ncbi:phosphotransferase, partial [Arthrobacter deserti]|nr:phosphotransferase [Arthrobacter deserti]